ncbi:unnamed protein product [Schistocephalus solidus]|uniref:long-chain-fatty-acid--CoA ligase n=1 Tax=Schistocephalus solidus TaxID=70667 RepID=A0A183SVP0_SCHSO|nr:unnamed protein product [Schistocephalus solidus]
MSAEKVPKIPFIPKINSYCTTIEDCIRVNSNYVTGDLPNLLPSSVQGIGDIVKEGATLAADRPCLGSHTSPTEPYTWMTYAEVAFIFAHFTSSDLSTVVCDTPARASKLFALTSSLECLKHIIIMKPGSEEMNSLKDKAGTSVQIHTFDEIVSSGPDDLILICYTSGTTGLPKGVMIPNKMMLASLNNNMLNAGIDILTEHDVYLSYLPLAHIFEQMFVLLTLCRHGRVGFYSGDPRTLTEDARALRPTVLTVVPRVLLRVYEGVQKKLGNSALRRWLFKKAMEAKCKDVDRNVFNRNTMWDVLFFSKVRALFGDRVRWITCGGAPLAPHVLRFTRAAFSCWVFEGYGSTETAGSMSISMASDLEGGHVGAPVPGLQLKLADVPSMDIVVSRDKKGEVCLHTLRLCSCPYSQFKSIHPLNQKFSPPFSFQICVRGPSCTPGYYKDPEKTAELLDSEGWMHTGDVAVWTEKNSLRIVDRCKHIFKLSQGEYIAPEKVETVYQSSPLISQVFVDGDAQQAFPVAIVVPELASLVDRLNRKSKMANGHQQKPNGTVSASGEPEERFIVMGKSMTAEQICKMEAAVNAVLEDMTELGKARGLKGFEQVRAIMLSPKAFSVENRMLTPTMKSAREVIRREFASAIKALYCSSSNA